MDNEPRNLTIGTLIGVAHALNSRVEIKLARMKGKKEGRPRSGGGKVKTRSLETERCGTRQPAISAPATWLAGPVALRFSSWQPIVRLLACLLKEVTCARRGRTCSRTRRRG